MVIIKNVVTKLVHTEKRHCCVSVSEHNEIHVSHGNHQAITDQGIIKEKDVGFLRGGCGGHVEGTRKETAPLMN